MMRPQVITTPFAGAERAAELLGVSAARTRRLISMAKESLEQENGAGSLTSRAKTLHVKTKKATRKTKKTRR